MIEKKNLYYIVKDGTKIIYKGKDEKKAKMLQSSIDSGNLRREELRERARYSVCY